MNKKESIRIAQLNAKGSMIVLHEARKLVEELKIDILCLQEPYTRRGKILGMPITSQIILTGGNPQAATIVYNKNITVTKLSQFCDSHTVCIEISTPSGTWALVNMYFQYSDPILPFLNKIREIDTVLGNISTIYVADANAKSPLWNSRITDEKGEELEELIFEKQLNVENKPNNPPTYRNQAGSGTNIDVTLSNRPATNNIKNWRVGQNLTSSDHNLIYFEVTKEQNTVYTETVNKRHFNIKRANWEKLRERMQLPEEVQPGDNVDKKAHEITSAIQNAMRSAIPLLPLEIKVHNKPWSDKLSKMRREARKARTRYQKNQDPTIRTFLLNIYRRKKHLFQQELYNTKIKCWEIFLKEQTTLGPWGTPFKIATNKIRRPTTLSTVKKTNGETTTSWRESVQVLMDTLLPDDNEQEDDRHHKDLRKNMETRPDNHDETQPVTSEEVEAIINGLKKNKAPGPDGIKSEVLQHLAGIISPFLSQLFNECLRQKRIPSIWKQSELVILKKGEDKDPLIPKSYRPICLLNILGKIQEKMLCNRLQAYREQIGLHPRQFGFRKGRSTEDAINQALEHVKEIDEKYVVGIFIDISGAFDNLWWPALFARLRDINCPRQLYESFLDYFKNRLVKIKNQNSTVSKTTTKGCPQGSVSGPIFWNIGLEPGLIALESMQQLEGLVAFADDVLLIISGNSRLELETNSNQVMEKLSAWCKSVKLQLATNKTTYALLKGRLQRNPLLKVDSRSIRRSPVTKYLGITLDEKLNFNAHIEQVCNKAKIQMNQIICMGLKRFQIPINIIRQYHNSIFVSIVGYGASAWAHKLQNAKLAKMLRSVQRGVLLRLSGAYSTTATDALTTVLGICPLDLTVKKRGAMYWLKRNKLEKVEEILGRNATSKQQVNQIIMEQWQNRWTSSETARRVFDIFPNIKERQKFKYLEPSKGLVHYLTGHGPYMAYLFRMNLAESSRCECGEEGTPEHTVWECDKTLPLRYQAQEILQNRTIYEIIRDENAWNLLDFATNAVSKQIINDFRQRGW